MMGTSRERWKVDLMLKYLVGIALIGIAIAFGVQKLQDKGTSSGPTVVTVTVPNPIPGGDSPNGGGEIYLP
jgi:hypothetical protein